MSLYCFPSNELGKTCRGGGSILFATDQPSALNLRFGLLFALILIAGQCTKYSSARADTVWVRGQQTPVSGLIVSTTDEFVEVRVFENGQFAKTINFPRTQIQQVVTNINPNRLALLDPAHPAAYRDYAEELASQKKDPAAQEPVEIQVFVSKGA